jgi:hypothetical protein
MPTTPSADRVKPMLPKKRSGRLVKRNRNSTVRMSSMRRVYSRGR